MSEYENINKLLNKGQRITDAIAREIVKLNYKPGKDNLKKVIDAMGLLNEVQKYIWKEEPELSAITKDNPQEESSYLKKYREHINKAFNYKENNEIERAIKEFQMALDMEPPHVLYEVAEKELESLKTK